MTNLLRPLHDFAVDLEQIGPLQGLVAEVLIVEVSVVDDGGVQTLGVALDDRVVEVRDHGGRPSMGHHRVEVRHDLAEDLLGLLVEVGDDDPGSEDGVVGVFRGHGG